jgi:hypothetical protein
MKRSPALLTSLALNLMLAGAVAWLAIAAPRPSNSVSSAATPAKTAASALTSTPIQPHPTSSDPREWLPQLREAGVPNAVIARLVAANFARQWEKRRNEMMERWERGELEDDDWAQFNRQRAIDEEGAVRAAVGDEAFKTWHEEQLLADLHLDRIPLSDSERDGVYALRQNLVDQQRDLDRRHRSGEVDDAHFEQQQEQLQAEYDAKTKALLGDDRFATLQRPNESTEGSLRRNLQNLKLAPAKIDAVVTADEQWREQRVAMDRTASQATNLSPDAYQAQLHAIDQEHDAALQRELGPDGLEALRQMQDDRYRKLTKYAPLWQLSPDEVSKVYDALRDYGQTVDEYRRQAQSRGLSYDATQPAIDQFRQSMSASLRASLGDAKYKQLAGSDVLDWDH